MTYSARLISFEELAVLFHHRQSGLDWPIPFILPSWLSTWWSVYGNGAEPHIISISDGHDTAGIAPLMLNNSAVQFMGNTDVCDYQDFIIQPGKDTVFFSHLIDVLRSGSINELNLGHVRPDSLTMTRLMPLCREKQLDVTTVQEEVSVEMTLPDDFEAYIASLDKKQRHEVRRKMRKCLTAGEVKYVVADEPASVAEAFPHFLRMFVESREDKAKFLDDKNEKFFKGLTRSLTSEKLLKIGSLLLDGKAIAAVMFFDYRGRRYLYNSGYDPDYVYLSAGLVNKLLTIKDAIDAGIEVFDFLKGNETYKYHLGGRDIPLYRCRINVL